MTRRDLRTGCLGAAALLLVVMPVVASAHVTVSPRVAAPGSDQTYVVRVPTEKPVATTSVELEVPDGVTVINVISVEASPHAEKRAGDRIVTITWTREIKPQERAEFTFIARNPSSEVDVTWKIRQRYADGTVSEWSPVTKIGNTSPTPQAAGSPSDTAAFQAWLRQYDAAFNAKDLDRLAAFYHPDVTIYEGGGINTGWADYRDHHLGPELKEMQNLQFSHADTKVTLLGDGQSAYVTSTYSIKARIGERDVDGGGLETLVLVRQADGAWKIRHAHTSSRPRRPPAEPHPGAA